MFKKFGVEKYDPINEQFDPHRHNAVFQVPDPTKDPDTVAVVLKVTYPPEPLIYEGILSFFKTYESWESGSSGCQN